MKTASAEFGIGMKACTTAAPYLGDDFFAVDFLAALLFTPEPFFRVAGEAPKCPR